MMNALYSAATGMSAQQLGLDSIANNLSNVNTTGFKAQRLTFEDLLYQQIGDRQASRLGAQVGMGVAPGRTEFQFTQGDLRETGIATNMAIEGDGFFQVMLPNGETAYTRDGGFSADANGQLVNASGHWLMPETVVPDTVQPGSLKIGPNGLVTGVIGGEETVLGQIEIARFANPGGLNGLGNNVYGASASSGPPLIGEPGADGGFGLIKQGAVEGSNVQVMNEMVNMITAQRAFESVAKVLSTSDEMLGIANSIRR